jgi:hypothetical protein
MLTAKPICFERIPNGRVARCGACSLACCLLAGLASTACGSDSQHTASSPLDNYGVPIAGCEQYGYDACDITTASCQANLFGLVQCVRKTPEGTLPPVTIITPAQYQDSLTQGSSQLNPDDLKRYEAALVLLGLASPGDLTVSNQVNVLVTTVSAYYTSDEKKVYVIRPDTPQTAADLHAQSTTLAHEFVHALQDQAFDLKQFETGHSGSYDANLATRSVVEGEAILYETMIRAAFDGLTPDQVNYTERFVNAAQQLLQRYATDSPYLITPRIFPYFYGGPYVYLQLLAAGRPGVDSLFASPPPASLPYIVSQGSIVDTPLDPVTNAAPTSVSGATLFAEDTLGAWLTYETLNHISASSQSPSEVVGGWRGDRLWIYNDGTTTNVAVIWRVRWSTQGDATHFVDVTNASNAPRPSDTSAASRVALLADGDAVVVAVSGSFDISDWEATAIATPTGSNGPDFDAGTAGSSQAGSILINPVPRMTIP